MDDKKKHIRAGGFPLPNPLNRFLQQALRNYQKDPHTVREVSGVALTLIMEAALAYVGFATPANAKERKRIAKVLAELQEQTQDDADQTTIFTEEDLLRIQEQEQTKGMVLIEGRSGQTLYIWPDNISFMDPGHGAPVEIFYPGRSAIFTTDEDAEDLRRRLEGARK